MGIEYEYASYQFKRKNLDPVSTDEYKLIKEDLDNFLFVFKQNFEEEKGTPINPHRFNKKTFLILFISILVIFLISYVIDWLGYQDAAEIISVLAMIPIIAIIAQPIQYVFSGVKSSSSEVSYYEEAKMYFKFHHSKAKETKNYQDYLNAISITDEKEFVRFGARNIF